MKLFKVLIVVLMFSWIIEPVMATDPITAGEEMISGGIKAFFVDVADTIFNYATGENTTVDNANYGPVVGSVIKVASYKYDPYQSNTVKTMRERTAIIGVFIFTLYVFYGAACVNLSCGGGGIFERTQYVISEIPLNEYKNILITAFVAILFTHYIFKFIILFNSAITTQVMYSITDSIRFTPDNFVLYLMMAICYGAELVFIAMRMLLMDLLAGCDILIGALFAFSYTRRLSIEGIKYFGRITLLQFIIVLVTAFGIALIEEFPFWSQATAYFALMLIVFVISAIITFGFSRMFSAAKTIVRRPYYSVY